MCAFLLTTMAVPCGFVMSCEHELVSSINPTCCVHRFYHNLNLFSYSPVNPDQQSNQNFSEVPSSPLPDLVVSHRATPETAHSNVPSFILPSSTRTEPHIQTKPNHNILNPNGPRLLSTSSSSFWSSQRTKHSTRKKNSAKKSRSRDLCPRTRETNPRIREMCHPCSHTMAESIRNMLEIRQKFPDSLPSRRQEFSLTWNSDIFDNDCSDCGEMEGCRDSTWIEVGRDLKRIADDFQFNSCQNKKDETLNIDSSSLLNFVTRTFFLSYIGVVFFKIFCKLR